MKLYRDARAHNARLEKLSNTLEDTARTQPESRLERLAELRHELDSYSQLWREHLGPLLSLYDGTRTLAESAERDRHELEQTFAELDATNPEDERFNRLIELFGGQLRQLAMREEHQLLPAAERWIPEDHVRPVSEQLRGGA